MNTHGGSSGENNGVVVAIHGAGGGGEEVLESGTRQYGRLVKELCI